MKKKTGIIEKIRWVSDNRDVKDTIENALLTVGFEWIAIRSSFKSEICDPDPDGSKKIGYLVEFNSIRGNTCKLPHFEENDAVEILIYWLFNHGKKRDLFKLYRAFPIECRSYIHKIVNKIFYALNNATISKGLISADYASLEAYKIFKRRIESDLIIPIINQVFQDEIQEYVNEEE